MKSYGKFQRGRYLSKEKKELLWRLDRWAIEELERIGIRVVEVSDANQHRKSRIVLERDGRRLGVYLDNPKAFYERMKPTPIIMMVASLLLHSIFVRAMNKVREGFESLYNHNYPRPSGVEAYYNVLERFEEIDDFFEGVREQVLEVAHEITNSDEFKEYVRG